MAEYIERDETLHRMKVDIRPPFAVVADMPAADVAPVQHGRWIYFGGNHYTRISQCTNCCAKYDFRSNYCPNCGAKMDLEV